MISAKIYHVLAVKTLASLHICTDLPEPSSQHRNMCWLNLRFVYCLCEQRRLLGVCTSNPAHLCNNQCVVSMRQVVIEFLNKTFASLPKYKRESGNRF